MVEKLSKRQERKKSISKKLSSKSPILAHIIVFSKYYYIWDKKWIFYDQIRALKSAALKHTFEFLLNVCPLSRLHSSRDLKFDLPFPTPMVSEFQIKNI